MGSRLKHIFGAAILFFVGIIMLAMSWRRWPDVFIDFGRELYVPWRINEGGVLYRDIMHLYGPFSQYFNALLFKIFGTGLMSLALFNIGLALTLTFLIYWIFLESSDYRAALGTGAVFLSIFAFSQYGKVGNYNFICPYSHEVTHGLLLAFFLICAFKIYIKRQKNLWLWIIGILLGLIFLTKVEVFLAISTALYASLALFVFMVRIKEIPALKILGIPFIGFLLPLVGFVGYFSLHMPIGTAIKSVLVQYTVLFTSKIPSNAFYLAVLGIDRPGENLFKLFTATEWYLAALSGFILFCYVVSRLNKKKRKDIFIFFILSAFIFLTPFGFGKIPWYDLGRPLPLATFALLFMLFVNIVRNRNNRQEIIHALPIFLLSVFGLILLFKMALNTRIFHYGFALAMPAALLLVMVILFHLPHTMSKIFGHSRDSGLSDYEYFRAASMVLVGFIVIIHVHVAQRVYALKTYVVGEGRDAMLAENTRINPRGPCVDLAVKKLKEIAGTDETFVVLPEGVMLNYLARRKNPVPYFEFTPPVVEMLGEEKIINALGKNPPDYILLAHKDTSEHGYRYFGRDYGREIFAWVKKNYTPIELIGNRPLSDEGFGIGIAKRRTN